MKNINIIHVQAVCCIEQSANWSHPQLMLRNKNFCKNYLILLKKSYKIFIEFQQTYLLNEKGVSSLRGDLFSALLLKINFMIKITDLQMLF